MDRKLRDYYARKATKVWVQKEQRCLRCSMWLQAGATVSLHGQLGALCSGLPAGRVRYRPMVCIPGMGLDPRDFPEYAEQVKAALAQARAEGRSITLPLVR